MYNYRWVFLSWKIFQTNKHFVHDRRIFFARRGVIIFLGPFFFLFSLFFSMAAQKWVSWGLMYNQSPECEAPGCRPFSARARAPAHNEESTDSQGLPEMRDDAKCRQNDQKSFELFFFSETLMKFSSILVCYTSGAGNP